MDRQDQPHPAGRYKPRVAKRSPEGMHTVIAGASREVGYRVWTATMDELD